MSETYEFPKKLLNLRTASTTLTEEQKQAASARLKQAREKTKTN